MRIPIYTQTEEVAGGCGTTSAQHRRATSSIRLHVFSSHKPHPHSQVSAARTTGAPLEGLPCYPLPARSQQSKGFVGKSFQELRPKPGNPR